MCLQAYFIETFPKVIFFPMRVLAPLAFFARNFVSRVCVTSSVMHAAPPETQNHIYQVPQYPMNISPSTIVHLSYLSITGMHGVPGGLANYLRAY